MKNFVINTILLLVSLTLMLVSAEFIVRWAYADITSTANMQTWFGARWKKEYVQLNSLGYREKEVSSSKDGSSFRIIVIGDSFGYGQGLPVTDRFSSLIESRLNQASDSKVSFEVLNFSVPGATSEDERNVVIDDALPLKPDFILIQWLPNDFESKTATWSRWTKDKPPWHLRAMQKSALYFVYYSQWFKAKSALGMTGPSNADRLMMPFQNPGSAEYLETIQPMQDLLDTLNDSGVDYAIALHPLLLPGMGSDYQMAPMHAAVLEMCKNAGARCIDLTPAFIALGADYDYTQLWVNRFDQHPSKTANELVAEHIVQELGGDLLAKANNPKTAAKVTRN